MERRQLGSIERIYHSIHELGYGEGTLAAVSQFQCDDFSLSRLKEAVLAVQKNQPLLQVHLERIEKTYHFKVHAQAKPPFFAQKHMNNEEWHRFLEEQLQIGFDLNAIHWRIFFRPINEREFELALFVHSMIIDQFAVPTFFDLLCQAYNNPNTLLPQQTLLPACDDFLKSYPRKIKFPPVDFILKPFYFEKQAGLTQRSSHVLFRTLTVTQTKKIMQQILKHNMSLEGYLYACLISSASKGNPISTIATKTINLRPWCESEIKSHYLCNATSMLPIYIKTASTIDAAAEQYDGGVSKLTLPNEAISPQIPYFNSLLTSVSLIDVEKNILLASKCLDQFQMGPIHSHLGSFHTESKQPCQWKGLHVFHNTVAASTLISLHTVCFDEQIRCSFSYTQPMLSSLQAEAIVTRFLQRIVQ